MQEGTNAVLIAPDLLEDFDAVNEALRSLKQIAAADAEAGVVGS
jgi:hypothetical protein